MVCTTNYTCVLNWYVAADTDTDDEAIASAGGPSAPDLNVTCLPKTGTIEFQVKDENDAWFTPGEIYYTVTFASNIVRFPRANMPEMRVIATGDATFAIHGALL